MTNESDVPPFDVALPRDFSARYGDGLNRGLCLGGGGLFFIAWQISYLHTLAAKGLHLDNADRVVGTSAGSVVAATLVGGHLGRVHTEISLLSKAPALISVLAPAGNLQPSQNRALDMFWKAGDAEPETIRSLGHAALAAATPDAEKMRRNLSLIVGTKQWPGESLYVTCVDTYTGQRCVVTEQAGVHINFAAAASSAVPGLFSPQPIGDRRCMDGGVSGTGIHLDLLAGASRVLVLALSDGHDVVEATMTNQPGGTERELEHLAASGTNVALRVPEAVDPEQLMSPAAIPQALAMGARQATADAEELMAFWN